MCEERRDSSVRGERSRRYLGSWIDFCSSWIELCRYRRLRAEHRWMVSYGLPDVWVLGMTHVSQTSWLIGWSDMATWS